MMNFKKGDKVVCVEPRSSAHTRFNLPTDTVFVVEWVDSSCIKLVGKGLAYSKSRFDFAPDTQTDEFFNFNAFVDFRNLVEGDQNLFIVEDDVPFVEDVGIHFF